MSKCDKYIILLSVVISAILAVFYGYSDGVLSGSCLGWTCALLAEVEIISLKGRLGEK